MKSYENSTDGIDLIVFRINTSRVCSITALSRGRPEGRIADCLRYAMGKMDKQIDVEFAPWYAE